ncbi:unnamed protein product, partial [Ectocarpus sp. 12 AP-2014]
MPAAAAPLPYPSSTLSRISGSSPRTSPVLLLCIVASRGCCWPSSTCCCCCCCCGCWPGGEIWIGCAAAVAGVAEEPVLSCTPSPNPSKSFSQSAGNASAIAFPSSATSSSAPLVPVTCCRAGGESDPRKISPPSPAELLPPRRTLVVLPPE